MADGGLENIVDGDCMSCKYSNPCGRCLLASVLHRDHLTVFVVTFGSRFSEQSCNIASISTLYAILYEAADRIVVVFTLGDGVSGSFKPF